MRYRGGIIDWTKEKLQEMDWRNYRLDERGTAGHGPEIVIEQMFAPKK